jgi:uncharacterized RDD family membrane protein YckC
MSEFQYTPQPESLTQQVKQHPRASIQHRLGGNVLDLALLFSSFFTLFLGWTIWSLVLWGQGQTPAKQILKMRVYSIDTGKPATWGHMAVRQFLIPVAFSCLYIPIVVVALAVSVDSPDFAMRGMSLMGSLAYYGLLLTDALFIFKGDERARLTDRWARTYVVNEAQ